MSEKARLKARLAEIESALAGSPVKGKAPKLPTKRKAKRAKKVSNKMSLKQAILQVTKGKPMTKDAILAEVIALGYKFNTSNPKNSVNVVLYGKKPKFKNAAGKFSPAK